MWLDLGWMRVARGPRAQVTQDPTRAISVQTMARRIAEAYSLDIGIVVVSFRHDIERAGRVELAGETSAISSSSYGRSISRSRGFLLRSSAMKLATSSCIGMACIRHPGCSRKFSCRTPPSNSHI
jgi:hypothetical protein